MIASLFCGCTQRKNLKDLSVVEGMGIDFDGEYVVITVQGLNLAKEGSGAEALSGNVTMNTTGKGKNITSAIENASESLSKTLFFGQNRILVFGMDMAKDYMDKSLDYLLRSASSRADVSVCISEDEALKIMESTENDSLVPAQTISQLLDTEEKNGLGIDISVYELLNLYTDKTSDIYFPVVRAGEKNVSISSIAIYDDDNIVSFLDKTQTRGFLFLKNKITTGMLVVNSEEFGEIGVGIIDTRTRAKVKSEGGKIIYSVKIKSNLVLDEVENGVTNQIVEKDIAEIEKLVQKEIENICTDTFTECVSKGSDCLRIGEMLAMCCPDEYAKLSDNWDDNLKNVQFEISAKCNLKRINENSKGN